MAKRGIGNLRHEASSLYALFVWFALTFDTLLILSLCLPHSNYFIVSTRCSLHRPCTIVIAATSELNPKRTNEDDRERSERVTLFFLFLALALSLLGSLSLSLSLAVCIFFSVPLALSSLLFSHRVLSP